jgi:tetratricopeptide (TPR) repeat protein
MIGFGYLKYYFTTYYAGFPFTMYQRVLTEFRVVVYYISLFFFPHPDRLNFDYDFTISQSFTDPVTTLLSAGVLIGLVLFAIVVSNKERLLSFGILWFIGNLAIESSIIPLDLIFEHRTYLPSVFLSVIVVTLLWRFITTDRFKMGLYLLITVLLAFWTVERNHIWSSPIVFWQDCVKKSPHKDRTHANLGKALTAEGRWDEAIAAYQKALQLNPYHQFALRNMGLAFYHQGKLDEAIDYYRRALQSDPDLADAHNDLGVALIDKKQLEEGIFHYREALRLQPNHPEAPANLRRAVEGLEKFNRQINITLDRLKTEPQNIAHLSRLGRLYFLKGNFKKAMEYYHQALSLDDRHLPALQGKAAVQLITKDYDGAVETYKEMLRIRPEDNRIYYNIACAYSLWNNKSQALHWLGEAVKNGFTKWELIEQDKDLANIRNTKEYQEFMASRSR